MAFDIALCADLIVAGKDMKWFCFFVITFSAGIIRHIPAQSYFVVWNVGQGQWATAVTPATCYHFDLGGEYFPFKKMTKQCRYKDNVAYISHWDWDHIGALAKWRKDLNLCLAMRPLGKSSIRKFKLLARFKDCPKYLNPPTPRWQPKQFKNSNEQSQVIAFKKILLPGDSPAEHERTWSQLPWVQESRVLLLGHHGSKTSTSSELLSHLPQVYLSIASARWARYKHPHSSIELRLKESRIPLLRTEDWGNIWLE